MPGCICFDSRAPPRAHTWNVDIQLLVYHNKILTTLAQKERGLAHAQYRSLFRRTRHFAELHLGRRDTRSVKLICLLQSPQSYTLEDKMLSDFRLTSSHSNVFSKAQNMKR